MWGSGINPTVRPELVGISVRSSDNEGTWLINISWARVGYQADWLRP